MNSWFDGFAKRAARSAAGDGAGSPSASTHDEPGLSRRQVLARGAVITGVAWTAPALLAARPAFAGASICTDSTLPDYSVCPDTNGTELCCPLGEECVLNTKGEYVCDVAPGGECTNRGNGQCNGGFSRCDQPSNTARFGICGGPGTICSDGSNCQFGNCEPGTDTGRRCGGEDADCASTDQCAPIDANDKVGFFCDFSQPSTTAPGTCQPNPTP